MLCLFFFLNDGLNTKYMLQCRQFHPPGGFSRALCNLHTSETKEHIFWLRSFSSSCWNILGICFGPPQFFLDEVISRVKLKIVKPLSFEVMTVTAWSIWKIFHSIAPSKSSMLFSFKGISSLFLTELWKSLPYLLELGLIALSVPHLEVLRS